MIARALAAKVPFAFVAADSVYGTGDIRAGFGNLDRTIGGVSA
jgi:SRSO17 transposase